jgi:hypothetical protein
MLEALANVATSVSEWIDNHSVSRLGVSSEELMTGVADHSLTLVATILDR